MNQVTPDEDVEGDVEREEEGTAEEASDTKALLTALAIVAIFILATLAVAFVVA